MRFSRSAAVLLAVLAQVSTAAAHMTGQHYHLPGRLDTTTVEPGIVVGLLAINAVVWLLALRAAQRFISD